MAHPHKSEAKSSHDRKVASYKGGPDGSKFSDKGTFSGGPAPDDMSEKKGTAETSKISRMDGVKAYKDGGSVKRLDRTPRASGGKVKGTKVIINIGKPEPAAAPAVPTEPPEMRSGPVVPPPPPMMGPPPGAGPMPMPRASGGKVTVKEPGRKDNYPTMDYGALSGKGRMQKVKAYGGK